jgi:saccharopine dehydrogenase-like NADP-dependent oxidoreductase
MEGKVETINYKTIRYPGHRQIMHLLMYDLFLENDKPTLKKILETAIPKIDEDVVIIYVAVIGFKQAQLIEENYVTKIYSRSLFGFEWSAMQITTASSLCAVVDLVLANQALKGFYCQEMLDYQVFLQNRFGKIFQQEGESRC